MKVLKEVQPKDWNTKTYCSACTSRLEVSVEDVYRAMRKGGRRGGLVQYFLADCPVCKCEVSVFPPLAVWPHIELKEGEAR